ncbi:MFS transporter [Porphyromonadaceae bacterium OttesenSCG-928-L07]|nr:MFS transporter [Porphyromonadaceae bacterium OttesenSCG-928-L07]
MNKIVVSDHNARQGLVIVCIAAFLVPFMGSALNLALPEISETFSMKAITLTWLAIAYMISSAIFQIPFARIADIVGRKKIFIGGVLIFSLCTFLCGFAPNGEILIGLRFLSGIGSAMMSGTSIAILTALFPPQERGKALGINTAVVYAALAAGPFLGGTLTHYMGWQSIFFCCAGLGIIVLILSRIFLKGEWIEARGQKFDTVGTILYGVGLAAVIYGFSTLNSTIGLICLISGILAFILFVLYEKRHISPVFNVRLFSGNRVFTLSSLAALINYSATSAISFMLSLYLQYVRGLDANHAGIILISQACVQSVFSLIAGHLTTRFDSSRMATLGMIIIVLGLGGLIFLGIDTPYWILICLLILLGIGFGIFSSPNTNVIMGSVEKKDYNQASASTGTMRLTGMAFSMGIASMAISFGMGNEKIVPSLYPAFMQSMKITFSIFLVLCCIGIYASSARIKTNRQ